MPANASVSPGLRVTKPPVASIRPVRPLVKAGQHGPAQAGAGPRHATARPTTYITKLKIQA